MEKRKKREGEDCVVVWTGLLTKVGMECHFSKGEILWATSSCGLWDLCVRLDSPTLLIKIVALCPTPLFHSTSATFIFCLFCQSPPQYHYSTSPSYFLLLVSQITSQSNLSFLTLTFFLSASLRFFFSILNCFLWDNFILLNFIFFLSIFLNANARKTLSLNT